MKKIIALFALVMLVCVACQREYELKPGDYFSISGGASITCWMKIENNLESAMDTLQRMYQKTHPNLYIKQKTPLAVDFPYDNRSFWLLTFSEDVEGLLPQALDSKGWLYIYFRPRSE